MDRVYNSKLLSWKRANPELRLMPLLEIIPNSTRHNLWMDFGAGDGLFSRMLVFNNNHRTVIKSDIANYADYSNLGIKSFLQAPSFRKNSFDGILCAQVLHYIPTKDLISVLRKLISFLKPCGFLVIIEYEMKRAYSWIPFPIELTQLISNIEIELPLSKINKKEISDGNRPKYSVIFEKNKI